MYSILFKYVIAGSVVFGMLLFGGCSSAKPSDENKSDRETDIRNELQEIVSNASGEVGVAVITPDGDTITVNNHTNYQLMSVFKLHEALAVSHALDLQGVSLDTIISFSRTEMNPHTWSPMLTEHPEEKLDISVTELMGYIIKDSDNNASNLLFDRIVSVNECDSFVRKSTGIEEFALNYTERQMQINHSLADGNHSSPLACALLMEKVFTDSIVSDNKQRIVQQMLLDCRTGQDRIYAPLKGQHGVILAHKTGSGFRNADGKYMAHNDIGRILLPDGRSYVLAVMVKNFSGTEEDASRVIADISAVVYNKFKQ